MSLPAEMRRAAPCRLVLLLVAVDGRHDVNTPADIGHVGRVVRAAGELVPGAGLDVVDVVGAGQDREAGDVADHGSVVGLDVGADVAPPRDHRAGAAEELDERRLVRIGVELVGRLGRQRVDHVLDGAYPGRVVDQRLHRIRIEQPSLVVRVLGVGGGAAAEEIEAEAAPGLGRIEIAEHVLAVDLLALQELGDGLHLLPGLRHAPVALAAFGLPCLGEARRRRRRRCDS